MAPENRHERGPVRAVLYASAVTEAPEHSVAARLSALLRRHGPAGVGYVVLTTVFYWTAVRHLSTRLVSDGQDGASFLWSYWAIPNAVVDLDNPFATDLLFHPAGAPLAFQTNTPLEAVIVGALSGVVGLTLAVNLVVLGAVVLSGLGAYLLALHQCGSRRAAFVAGAAFAFLPWHQIRALGHHNLNHTWVLPFTLLALLLLYDRPTPRRAAGFGAMVGVALLTDLTFAVFVLLAAGVIAVWRHRETFTRLMGLRLLQAAGVAVLASLPLVLAMAQTVAAGDLDPVPGWGSADLYGADLLSWVVPHAHHRWWGERFAELNAVTGGERLAYPGVVVLGLAVVGVVPALRRRRGAWIAVFLTSFVLSLGPFLKVNGYPGTNFGEVGDRFILPLPYRVFHLLPILSGLRVPARFSVMGALALDVLAAVALVHLSRGRPRLAWALPAVAVVVVVVEFLPVPFPKGQSPRVPQPYAAIEASADHGAVLEIPLQWRDGFVTVGDTVPYRDDTIFLYYATRHGRPLVSGMVARYPNERRTRLTSVPLYRQVLALQGEPGFIDPARFDERDLRALGIGFVVYHRDRPEPPAFDYVAGLGMQVLADDGTVIVWKVPRRPPAAPAARS